MACKGSRGASPVLRTCGGVGLIGLGLIETCLSCCTRVAWGLRASRDASTTTRRTTAPAASPLRPTQRREAAGGAAGGGHFCRRLDLEGIVDRACPIREVATLTHGQVICALVSNRLTSPTPLRRVEDWARAWAVPEVFGIASQALNDDRIGRALDAIAPKLDAIVGAVGARAIAAFGV